MFSYVNDSIFYEVKLHGLSMGSMECSIINRALSLMMKHLVIGQRQKAPTVDSRYLELEGTL